MRKHALDALFPRTRQAVLAATLLAPERSWYMSELAKRLDVRPSSIQRELAGLVDAGVLRRYRDGNRVYYQANAECPFLPDLQRLLAKTAGLADVLRRVLARFGKRVRLAFIYGSIARSEEHAASDVDLLVVGSAGLADLAPAIKKAEEQLQRPINPLTYSPEEFARKARSGHHLLADILGREKIFVTGDARDLEALTGQPPHSRPPHKPAGNRRPAGTD
jgi:predicted nucleotidyltransferase